MITEVWSALPIKLRRFLHHDRKTKTLSHFALLPLFSGKNIVYETVSNSRIAGEFKSMFRLPTTEEERAKMREQKKAVKEFKELVQL